MNGLRNERVFGLALVVILAVILLGCSDNGTETRYVDYSGIQVADDVPDKTCRSCHAGVHTQ